MPAQEPSSRRHFLRSLGFSALGLGLADALQARTPGAAPQGFGKAKRCLVLFLWGGPSHIDTFDMKPDAPAEYRGDFRPIQTTIPGLRWCEHLPRLVRVARHLAVVRSLTMQGRGNGDHHIDAYYLLTGQP